MELTGITDEFIAHESGTDAEGREEARWLKWVADVEKIIGADLDGNGDTDGYCLDFALHAWMSNETPEGHAAEIARNRAALWLPEKIETD